MLDDILGLIADIDPREVIRRFDVDFDIPGRAAQAVGLLRLAGAFSVDGEGDVEGDAGRLAVRVGAAWCELVQADVQFDLARALAMIDESEDDAQYLARRAVDPFEAYCLARWYDGSGKVLYRIGSHYRGRMNFARAVDVATSHDLWWCSADLSSNLLRSRLEEARQAGASRRNDAAEALAELESAVGEIGAAATRRGIALDPQPVAPDDRELREYLRGYCSLLHNLSWALAQTDPARSLALSRQAGRIAETLGDEYRQAQALNHQGLVIRSHHQVVGLPVGEADVLFERVLRLGWQRGRRIAEQQLARGRPPREAAERLAELLARLEHDAGRAGRAAGLDVDLRWYTVDAFEQRAGEAHDADPSDQRVRDLLDRAREEKLGTARSVRRVIALPAYKRAYGMTVRPIYLQRIQRLADEKSRDDPMPPERREELLSLAEESTGRELLDLMSSVDLPTLDAPSASAPAAVAGRVDPVEPVEPVESDDGVPPTGDPRRATRGEAVRAGGVRRAAPGRRSAAEEANDRDVLAEREREFEQQFLTRPLQAAPHDEEIARRATMYVANHPGTRFVRYFTQGWLKGRPERLGAFVVGESVSPPIDLGPFDVGRELVDQLLTDDDPALPALSAAIWEHLVAPVWDLVDGSDHLVLIPTDDLFAVPFHIAAPDPEPGPGADADVARPLAARLPLSQAVSLTAFLTRGRHLLRRQRTTHDDDLAALVVQDRIAATELVGTGWHSDHVHVAGDVPRGLSPGHRYRADWEGLAALTACRPEFFVYSGHGNYVEGFGELGPYLQLGREERLTSYDVALRLRLPRNVLTVVGACLAGQGSSTQGGDVAGFLRAFIAAGSGALGLPLWPVYDEFIADTTRHLLRASRPDEAERSSVFDVVDALHRHYVAIFEDADDPLWWDRMPIALYT